VEDSHLEQVDYQQLASPSDGATTWPEGDASDNTSGGLTLDSLQQMALGANPALEQADAQMRALRGKCLQVGLPPNPTAGYVASEVGNEGTAGQQGAFAGQTFITAGKLAKNRAIVAAELAQAEERRAAIERRVRTDVRIGYYQALVAEKRVKLTGDLVRVGENAKTTSKKLLELEEIPLSALLQSEVQLQNAVMQRRVAENARRSAWQNLSAVVGGAELAPQSLEGDLTELPTPFDWHEELARIQAESPEIAAAMASVDRARRVLSRACVEAIPNISTQVSLQHDDGTGDTITGVQVGVPLPLWNRNQGGIRQAQAKITQARRQVDRVELDLQRRLTMAYQDYANALAQVEIYSADILPRAEKTLDLVQRAFREAGEIDYLDFLTAQRTYSAANLAYLDAVGQMWESWARIDGLLLSGSLDAQVDLGYTDGGQ